MFGGASGRVTGGASCGVSSLVQEHVIIRVLGRQCGMAALSGVSASGKAAGVAYILRLGQAGSNYFNLI